MKFKPKLNGGSHKILRRVFDFRHRSLFYVLQRISMMSPAKLTPKLKVLNNNYVRDHRKQVGSERLKSGRRKPITAKVRLRSSWLKRNASGKQNIWGIYLHMMVKRRSRQATIGALRFTGMVRLYKQGKRPNRSRYEYAKNKWGY